MLPPLIKIYEYIHQKGYDLFPIKKNGKFKIMLWHNDTFIKEGNEEYKDCQHAIDSTYIKLYKHFKSRENGKSSRK